MKLLQILNAVGVTLLTGLCILQWRDNHRLRQSLDSSRNEESLLRQKLSSLDAEKSALQEDLDSFRQQLGTSSRGQRESQQRLRQAEAEIRAGAESLARLRHELELWQTAGRSRDSRIAELDQRLKDLGSERDKTTALYREAILRLQQCQSLLQERTRLYNQLVETLNSKP